MDFDYFYKKGAYMAAKKAKKAKKAAAPKARRMWVAFDRNDAHSAQCSSMSAQDAIAEAREYCGDYNHQFDVIELLLPPVVASNKNTANVVGTADFSKV